MATRLTLHYTVSVFILLAVAAMYLYSGLEASVERGNRGRLDHRVRVLALLLKEQPDNRSGIEQEVRDEARVSAQSQTPFFLRVLDGDGRIVTETPGMTPILSAGLFASAISESDAHVWRSADATYLLDSILVPATPGSTGWPKGWRIQAAVNISAGEHLLSTYRRDIAIMLLMGLLIAAPIGAWIARHGLRPIDDITQAAEQISIQQLEQRINAGNWPQELRALADAFDRMLERLQAAFQRLSQFSADLAHEFRTPLNNLMGEAQVTLSRERSAPEYVRVLQSALEEQVRLARMIDSMLFLAQAEQVKSALEPAALDARNEMRAVADFYQALAEEQGVQLICEGEGKVVAESMLLRRALSNLLSNALRYSGPGGRVVLRVSSPDDNSVALSVIDSGVGIDPHHLPKLGDRFYRADPSRADSSNGAGLGLAIVKSIMALHGGSLLIASTVGKGTTASLVFEQTPRVEMAR